MIREKPNKKKTNTLKANYNDKGLVAVPEGKKRNKAQKKKKLPQIQSCQSFIPIQDISDGIIITKDRKYVKILEVEPINFLLRSADEQADIISNFAAMLRTLPALVQFKVISRKADVTGFINKIREDMQTEENTNCLRLQQEQINLINEVSMNEGISRRFFIIFQYEEPKGLQKSPNFKQVRSSLMNTAALIEGQLLKCGNNVKRIDSNTEVLSLLYSLVCRSESGAIPFEDRMDEVISRYLANADGKSDSYIPVTEFIAPRSIDTRQGAKYLVIDGTYYCFAYIPSKAYSSYCTAGWLSQLINLGEDIDVDLFVKKEPIEMVQQKLAYALRYNKVRARDMEDTNTEYDEVSGAIQSGYYLKQGLSNGEDFCYMSVLLTITAQDIKELDYKINAIKTYMISQNSKMDLCWFMQDEAFLMSLPLCRLNDNIYKRSRRNALTSGISSAYPFVSFEFNDENGILFGVNRSNNSLIFIDNFDSTKYKNANMAILGTSGAGKTFTLQCMALRMREKKTQVFIIAPDKGHEFIRACNGIGGQYINISAGSHHNINIMEIRKTNSTMSEIIDGADAQSNSILAAKIQQLHTFFSLLIPDIRNEEKQYLDEALVETYLEFGITSDNNSLISEENPNEYKKMPILSDLYQHLKTQGNRSKRLCTILKRYVTGSASSFNGQTNVNLDNKYIVLDISRLTPEMRAVGMFIALDYVWDKAREDRTAKKVIFVDELWRLIGEQASKEAAEFVVEIFRVIRGYGGSAVAATQNVKDFFAKDDGRFGEAIINNSKIKLLMGVETKEAQDIKHIFELTDAETSQISYFERGEGLLLANSNHVLVNFKASPTETKLVNTDRKTLKRDYGGDNNITKIPNTVPKQDKKPVTIKKEPANKKRVRKKKLPEIIIED